MAPQLLQVKIDPLLKDDLKDIAEYKGIPVTAYVKMTLKEAVRKEKRQIFSENGLTEEQEFEILKRGKELKEIYKKGKGKSRSAKKFIEELES
jgi:antitoxin component of RelBE/YafQ-DinJ toxin-antitoxin module